MANQADLLQGTLYLLILETFCHGSLHGYGLGIATRLRRLPGEAGNP